MPEGDLTHMTKSSDEGEKKMQFVFKQLTSDSGTKEGCREGLWFR